MGIQLGSLLTLIALLWSTYLDVISLKQDDEEENKQAPKMNKRGKGKEKEKEEEKKKKKEEKKRYRNISICLTIAYIIYLIVGTRVGSTAFSIVSWMQNHKVITCIYIGIAAILPPALACLEQKRGTFTAGKHYARNNLVFNLLGVIAITGLLILVQWMISDLYLLKGFYIEEIAATVVPICIWMVLTYQKTERQIGEKNGLDHDASLKNWNQKANLLHLFNMFSLAIISVVYIVAYTIYCQRYHVNRNMNAGCYIALTFTLLFFYALSQHRHRYLNLIAYVVIPVILVASVYWMSWFSMNDKERDLQGIFVAFHSVIYIVALFRKEGVGIFGKREKENAVSNSFLMVFPIIIVALYTIVWNLPKAIDRLPDNEAHSYIDILCADTDTDADSMIQKSMDQDMYDEQSQTYDVEMFLQFLSSELENELMTKGVIEKSGEIPSRDNLSAWCFDEFRRRKD